MPSPYDGAPPNKWSNITSQLIKEHPLRTDELVDVVRTCWESIFASRIGRGFHIGKEIFPKPQIMGFLLHELIPLELQARYPKTWRGDLASTDKDIVYIPDNGFSIEVKTSSHPVNIFGNRSYAQEGSTSKKAKNGYFLTVNFQKFTGDGGKRPEIVRVRFGWLDSTDWIGQAAATGQQAHVSANANIYKLLEIYRKT
jgi:hypothetical protein